MAAEPKFRPVPNYAHTPSEIADVKLAEVREWLVAAETETRALKRDVRGLCEENDKLQKRIDDLEPEVMQLKAKLAEAQRKLANADFVLRNGGVR